MTVTYTAEVATCRGFGCFLKLLTRWKGSIYKLVWPDLIAFLGIYYSLSALYRFVLDPEQKKVFEEISEYCETYSNLIPLSFVLGFYVSVIMTRWWDQYQTIPWTSSIAVYVSSCVHGQDERGRLMRRTIMRYVCLCLTMVFTMISPRVKKRFPTIDHFVEAGLLLENEKAIIVDLNNKFPRHSKHWLPIVWAASIVTRARKEGRIRDDFAVKTIIDEINRFRGQCGLLLNYDSISVPLVYTQVVTLATYSFFITSVLGRQWLDIEEGHLKSRRNPIDYYFPVLTTLQFFFYMGWLKVAESLINPFGEDDDDFEVNWIVDRNVTVSYLIVDEMHHEHPELIKDQYWDEVFPTELPYTVAAEPFRERAPQPSTANIAVSAADQELLVPSSLKVESDMEKLMSEDAQSGIHFLAKRSGSRMSISGERPRTYSGGSTTSVNTQFMGSTGGSLHRVGSVTSVLKRLFSRDTTPAATVDGNVGGGPMNIGGSVTRLPSSRSSDSLATAKYTAGGSVRISDRIADQVIEEVDEQQTITSMANKPPEQRPTMQDIFPTSLSPPSVGPPTPSDPLPIPPGRQTSTYFSHSAPNTSAIPPTSSLSPARSTATFPDMLSMKSAPGFGNDNSSGLGSGSIGHDLAMDTISIGSNTDSSEDEFTKLKRARRQERILYARSVSAQPGAGDGDQAEENESLLVNMIDSSRTGPVRSPRSSVYSEKGES
ncbi:bestrophin-4 isoform X2 [Macrosteles quadrilineatus]|uniref:bestrophin-4 isoform X2 n=1 Tax=Macrosteles quadrilineatus TaxID=74068 RepID=UPI0023E10462|nr:bestrophin-4 isoform X2 [Macrosteles quadrilineatus]